MLDFGSGAGLDVLLSARLVGPTGKVYGLDMTSEMLALAREYQQQLNIDNVEFLKGDIESIPLPDEHVDVVDPDLWASCVGGALEIGQYPKLLQQSGFVEIEVQPVETLELSSRLNVQSVGCLASAFIRAVKPGKGV